MLKKLARKISKSMALEESRHIQPQPHSGVSVPAEPRQFSQPAEVIIREIIETLLLTLFIFWLVNAATGRYRVQGHSMLPTMQEGEYLIINKLAYYLDQPQHGDIIVLHYPRDRTREYIKRVIGVPGDRIEIDNGQVRVNGVVLDEPYIADPPNYSGSWTVPDGNYFVLGDNRNNSSDSHSWLFLPRSDIVGKAWVVYWPYDEWQFVPHHNHPLN